MAVGADAHGERMMEWSRRAARHALDRLLLVPLYEGRLQLTGTRMPVIVLSIFGLGVLCNLLVALLFDDLWRSGSFVELAAVEGGQPRLMPLALTPITLAALGAGWVLIVTGGAVSSQVVRLSAAGFWLLANGASSRPLGADNASIALEWAPQLVRGSYVAVAVVLVLFSFPLGRRRWAKPLTPVAILLAALGVATFFGSQMWLHVDLVRSGGSIFGDGAESSVPSALDIAIQDIELMLLPLLYLAGVAVAEFAYDVASALIAPFEDVSARLAKTAVLALIAGKLVFQHVEDPGYWITIVQETPAAAVHTVLAVAYLGGVVALGRRLAARWLAVDAVREPMTYGTAAIVFLPAAIVVLLLNAHVTLLLQFRWDSLADLVDRRAEAPLERERVVLWLLALGAAAWALRYRRPNQRLAEAAVCLAVVATWGLAHDLWFAAGRRGAWDERLVDLEVTALVGIVLVARFRSLSARAAALLGGLVLFTWLVTTRFGILSTLSDRIGLGDAFVAVFGVVFVLLAGSAFVRGDGRLVPRLSRPLIWIGYLVVSTAILNWVVASRSGDSVDTASEIGLFYLGYPLAAWIIARRGFAASDEEYLRELPADVSI